MTRRALLAAATGAALVGWAGAAAGAPLRTAQDKLREKVSVKDFGARGDGVTDDTGAFQAAITYCLSAAAKSLASGNAPALYVPQGVYIISTTLNLPSAVGFWLQGAGEESTSIIFTANGAPLFAYGIYQHCKVSDISLAAGTVSINAGVASYTAQSTPTNTAMQFSGIGGGANFTQNNVRFIGWARVYDTSASTVNCDNHRHWGCYYAGNLCIWNNTNTQAVAWSFIDCQAMMNVNCFVNPGCSTKVIGGDWINSGDFCTITLAGITDLAFQNLNFENFQNLDPTKNPRFLVTVAGVTAAVNFSDCRAIGGGTLAGKESANLAGLVTVRVVRCSFSGNWNVLVASSSNGVTSSLIFDDCASVPAVVQTLSSGQGNRPLNLEYKRLTANGGSIDRVFNGALGTQSNALRGTSVVDNYHFESILNAASDSKVCPVFVPAPYIMQLSGAEIAWTNNTGNTCVIEIWTDSTKAVKLASVTTAAASGQYQVFDIPPSSILANYPITAASAPLYVVVTAAGNAGFCKMNIGLKLRQVS